MSNSIIGVHNEWDPLKSVICGTADGFTLPQLDWVLDTYTGITDEIKNDLRENYGKRMDKVEPENWKIVTEQQDNLARILADRGIEVTRPITPSREEIEAGAIGYTGMFERDNTLAVGNEVINIFCRTASRRKNHPALHKQITEIVSRTGQKHISQPWPAQTTPLQDETQPYLEGGDIFVMGKDILVGHAGIATSYAGIEWLQAHLAPQGYKIHTIELTKDWIHLDCVLSTPREGLAMACFEGIIGGKKAFPDFMQDWTWLEATKKEAKALGCNGVNIAPSVTVIGSEHTRIIGMLEKNGVECIGIPFDYASTLGGGPRCTTHPLIRQA